MGTFVLLALWLFLITNIDTMIILIAFFTDDHYQLPEVIIGYYVGYIVGLIGAIIGAIVAAEVLQEQAFLLGIVPIILGVRGLIVRQPLDTAEQEISLSFSRRIEIVAMASIGVSGENIAVYVPYFVGLTTQELVTVIGIFLLGAGGIVLVSRSVAHRFAHAFLPASIERIVVPLTLIIVGVYVLLAGWIIS